MTNASKFQIFCYTATNTSSYLAKSTCRQVCRWMQNICTTMTKIFDYKFRSSRRSHPFSASSRTKHQTVVRSRGSQQHHTKTRSFHVSSAPLGVLHSHCRMINWSSWLNGRGVVLSAESQPKLSLSDSSGGYITVLMYHTLAAWTMEGELFSLLLSVKNNKLSNKLTN